MSFDSGRRSSFKKMILGGAAAGTLTSLDWKETKPLALKGNINHGVCAWTMPSLSLDELCVAIKKIGFNAIDLVGPKGWDTLKAHDVECSMCNGAELGIPNG